MKKKSHSNVQQRPFIGCLLFLFFGLTAMFGQDINTKKSYIRADQFGYPVTAKKKAIIAKAVQGFNAGAGIDLDMEIPVTLRNTSDDAVVFEALAIVWNEGGIDALSGDAGWWFDFSEHCTAGSYYIEVTEVGGNTIKSNPFEVSNSVYDNVLRVAVETFYYQRMAQNKTGAYGSGSRWTDGEWYTGPGQDTEAKFLYEDQTKDVSGGWIDAGDPNKYITFATAPVHNLLTTYQQHPDLWNGFELRIPENGNDLPDLLDEVKWELEWIKKMQNPDGTVHSKAGIREDFNYISPPSSDTRERWYAQTCPAAAITASGMLAHGALVLQDFGSQATYAEELTVLAELSWQAYNNAPDKAAVCDNGEIEAGDADGPGDHYLSENVAEAVTAAVYLFALTGKEEYQNFIVENYAQARGFVSGDWGIYRPHQSEAVLYYTTLPNADTTAKNGILTRKLDARSREARGYVLDDTADFYQVNPYYLNWGSNSLLARQATDNYDYVNYGLDETNHKDYEKTAEGILHYFHGTNPLGIVMLSNMYEYGAEFSSDQLWHTWFNAGSPYDGADGTVGPAPGFLTGGVNPLANENTKISLHGVTYEGARLGDQPGLKAYSDENDYIGGANESPWALVEPAIYYQSSYVKLLANYVARYGGTSDVPSNEGTVTEGILEIESVFSVYEEAGTNSEMVADTSNPGASAGGHVRMFDEGDALTFNFQTDLINEYALTVRLRVGEASGTETNLAELYSVFVDGDLVEDFALDLSSISDLDGDTYWGELKTTLPLQAGEHTVVIAALRDWLKADRFTYAIAEEAPQYVDDIASIEATDTVTPNSEEAVTVTYTAGENREVVISFQQAVAPYAVYSVVTTAVSPGNGELTVLLTIPEDVELGEDQYQFQAYILPVGGEWSDRFDNLAVTGVDVTDGTPPPGTDSGYLEIEDVFEAVSDLGNNNTVGPDTYNPGASNGIHVRLFDAGDALKFDFNVSQEGTYDLGIRLRVGENSGTESNLVGEYEIQIDGVVQQFSLVEGTTSELDLDSYWGTLGLTTNLDAGIHTVTLTALRDWLKADSFSYELVGGVAYEDDIVSVSGPDTVSPGSTKTISIDYTSSADRDIVASFQQGIAPYSVYDIVINTVQAGSGTLEVSLEVPADLELAVDTYQFQVFIAPVGGTWPDRIDNMSVDGVDGVEDDESETQPGVLEIEDVFEVIADVGSNNTVGVDSFNPAASNGKHVRLFDAGDELAFDFEVNMEGSYDLAIRLRVGEASGTDSHLVGEYEISVDGVVRQFQLIEGSISELDIDAYWGELGIAQDLAVGTHTIHVKALRDWLKADRFSYTLLAGEASEYEDDIRSVQGPLVVEKGSEVTIEVAYSASTDREVLGWFQLGVAPYTIFDTQSQLVSAGEGEAQMVFAIGEDLTASKTDYQFQILIVPPGGSWPDRLDNEALVPVEVKDTNTGKTATYALYPNPSTNGNIQVDTPNAFEYNLTNFAGRSVLKGAKEKGDSSIRLDGLTPGIYVIQTKDLATGKVKVSKVIIR